MSERTCANCRYWTRHEPKDAGGYCAKHRSGMAFEDETCPSFAAPDTAEKE